MKPNETLLIIDMQNDYYPGGAMELIGIEEAHANLFRLIEQAHRQGNSIIYVQHLASESAPFFRRGTSGAELYSGLPIRQNDVIIQKHYPNSFRETSLQTLLDQSGIKKLLVCGAMTHMCIDTTVRAGYDLGYDIRLVGDACATRDLEFEGERLSSDVVHRSFLSALDGTFCQVLKTTELL